jgi:hypothetical protein
MPEMIRKPVEPIKAATGVVPPGISSLEQGGEMPRSATTSTSATPATSAAASPAPTLNSQDESKDKEVRIVPYFDFVNYTVSYLLSFRLLSFHSCVVILQFFSDHTPYHPIQISPCFQIVFPLS